MNGVLEQSFAARKPSGNSEGFTVVPEGFYSVIVVNIKDWVKKVKTSKLNLKDENGQVIKENGVIQKEEVKDYEFYNCNVMLEITEGEFKGKKLFTDLTTHANAVYRLEHFLYAIELQEVVLNDLQELAKGCPLRVRVVEDSYEKVKTDNETGLDTVETVKNNRVVGFYKDNFATKQTTTIDLSEDDLPF